MADNETQTAGSGRRRLDLGARPSPASATEAAAAETEKAEAAETEAAETEAAETEAEAPPVEPVDVFAVPPLLGSVKLRAPENAAPITLDGEDYAPDEKGLVEVPAKFVAVLRAHGYTGI